MLQTRCFKSVLDTLLHVSNEGLTLSIHIVLLFCIAEINSNAKENASAAVVGIIVISWAVNIFFSALKVLALIIEKIKKMRKKGDVAPDENSEELEYDQKNKKDLIKTEVVLSVIDLDGDTKGLKINNKEEFS